MQEIIKTPRIIESADEWMHELEQYAKQETVQDKFVIDEVVFPMIQGFRVAAQLYRAKTDWGLKHVGNNLPWLVNLDYKLQGEDVTLNIDKVVEDVYKEAGRKIYV